ncbi:MAG: hypothetical protein QCI38_03010, partial [Candidatus Thermoplasmatota archaeon]|nr:hypothetical protein [Candidatus Thermoplasmatota archaeon]
MKILIIPTTDWFKHPTPHRHHYLAEQLKHDHEVLVLHFDIFSKSEGMKPDPAIRYLKAGGSPDENLSKYYIKNWRTHKKRIRDIISEEKVDVVFGANLLPTIGAFQEVRRLRKSGKKCLGVYDFSDFFPQSAAIYSDSRIKSWVVKTGSN